MARVLFWIALALGFASVSTVVQGAPAVDLSKRTTPVWFDDAKLGIFVHWPVGSIPAYASLNGQPGSGLTSWESLRAARLRRTRSLGDELPGKSPYTELYALQMLTAGSATERYHSEHYGKTTYEQLVAQFRDEVIPGWDPQPWVDLFARAGARYVVFTTRLDDGFLFWPSSHPNPYLPDWQSRRDVVGELEKALRARGLRVGLYYSGGVDYTFAGVPMNTTAAQPVEKLWGAELGGRAGSLISPRQRQYVNTHWRELIERYRPDVIWNDYFYPGETFPAEGKRTTAAVNREVQDLFQFYLAQVPEGVINDRFNDGSDDSHPYADFQTFEYSISGPPKDPPLKWESNRGIGTAYGYNRLENDQTYLSSTELIHMFVDVVSRGGNLLLNVGPMSSGEIPWPQAERLLELGWWLRINGAAIYGTRPWQRTEGVTGEGLEVRYTASEDSVHAILLGTPASRVVELDLRLDPATRVTLEGTSRELKWQPTSFGVRVELATWPEERPALSLRFSPKTAVRPL